MTDELVVPDKVSIPADLEDLASQLAGLARLATASEWARAAIVAAWVDVSESQAHVKSDMRSCAEFAELGYAGLKSHNTVRAYAKAWLDRYPRPQAGETVELPSEPWPKADPHVKNNTGDNEWYTPPIIIESARAVMGSIDTDPASNPVAQEWVKAGVFYTQETDGLIHPWHGNVWLNPPYAADLVGRFIDKLAVEIETGRTKSAVVLTNNATETAWGATLLAMAAAVCFHTSRVRFIGPDGEKGAPLQGQMLAYIGETPDDFAAAFAAYGPVLYG